MNILYLTNHLNIGGITSYVFALSEGLKQKGHNIYLASSGGECLMRFRRADISYLAIPIKTKSEVSPKIFLSMRKLSPFIEEKGIEIIHSNSRTTQVLGCLLKRKRNITHISTCHGFFKTRISRRLFPCWGDKVIAISESVKEHLIDDFKVDPQDIRVIYNGIDVEKFKRVKRESRIELRNRFGLGQGPVVGIIARLSDVKGHIYLIEAMKQVVDRLAQAQLVIIGEGKMKKGLLSLTKKLTLTNNVFFIPNIIDTSQALSLIDIFVMPSLKEGLGLSLMEAMAAGKAVIGSNVGGITNLIQDGCNGLLVEPKDAWQLSRMIINLLNDPAKRESFGKKAQIFIKENFPKQKMVFQTEEFYRECLNER